MTEQNIALAAAFNRQGALLLLKRSGDVHCAGLWSLPGGKIQASEPALEAARRELQEETCLAGEQWQLLGECAYSYPDRRLKLFLFSCVCPDISLLHTESRHAWVSPDDLGRYPMPAANCQLLPLLMNRNGNPL